MMGIFVIILWRTHPSDSRAWRFSFKAWFGSSLNLKILKWTFNLCLWNQNIIKASKHKSTYSFLWNTSFKSKILINFSQRSAYKKRLCIFSYVCCVFIQQQGFVNVIVVYAGATARRIDCLKKSTHTEKIKLMAKMFHGTYI